MKKKSLIFATALCLLGSSGCAVREVRVTCVMPPVPKELPPAPEPGWFTNQMNSILLPYESLPDKPTK